MRQATWYVPPRGVVVPCSCGMSVKAGMRSLLRLGKVSTSRRGRSTIRLLWGRAVVRRRMVAELVESSLARRYLRQPGSVTSWMASVWTHALFGPAFLPGAGLLAGRDSGLPALSMWRCVRVKSGWGHSVVARRVPYDNSPCFGVTRTVQEA